MIEFLFLVVYAITVMIHYAVLPGTVMYGAFKCFNIQTYVGIFYIGITYISTALVMGYYFNGCIFSYIEEYYLVQAGWQMEPTYSFENSLVYQLVFQYFE